MKTSMERVILLCVVYILTACFSAMHQYYALGTLVVYSFFFALIFTLQDYADLQEYYIRKLGEGE